MRVGVIVAARGPAPYLREALTSVLAQDRPPDQVVLVDHASWPPLVAPPGVELVRLDDGDGGPAAARQAGLAACDAELIALADSDDVWEQGKLRAQVATLQEHPEGAVCFGRAVAVDADGEPTGEEMPSVPAGVHAARDFVAELYESNPIPAASAVIRREVLEQVGGFAAGEPLPAGSDWDLWLRVVGAGHAFVCEPAACIRYRRHSASLTSDVARLAEAGLLIHERHAGLVEWAVSRRARARDLETLARGRIRERRYADARRALDEAAVIREPGRRERALRALVRVPGLRAALGRRAPFR